LDFDAELGNQNGGRMQTLADRAADAATAWAEGAEIEVSVVMPCLNEARTVGTCVTKAARALQALGVRGEVIVADNGSTDGSQVIARSAGARVVDVTRRGYGAALRGGIAAARGRYIIMGDADDSYDFTALDGFVERLRVGDELVMGNRFKGGIRPGAMPWANRYVGNPALTMILNLFFRTDIGDSQCGLRAFRADAYARLGMTADGMEFASEMVVKAALKGLKVGEVPVVLHPDGRGRPPHLRPLRDGWRNLKFLLLHCPLWLFVVPAALLLGAGLGLMVWLAAGPRPIGGGVTLGVHTMLLGVLCALLGHQALWFGLFGKVFAHRCGVLPRDRFAEAVVGWLTPERGVAVGGGIFLVGLGANAWLAAEWWRASLGALEAASTLRYGLWGLAGMVLGGQVLSNAFFLALLRQCQPRDDIAALVAPCSEVLAVPSATTVRDRVPAS
jgi:hypothetical protein